MDILIFLGLFFIFIFHITTRVVICRKEYKLYDLNNILSLFSFLFMQILWILAFISVFLALSACVYDIVLWQKLLERKQKYNADKEKLNKIQNLEKEFLEETEKDNLDNLLDYFKTRIKKVFSLLSIIKDTKGVDKVQLFVSDAIYSQLLYQSLSQKLNDKYVIIRDIRAEKLERFSGYYLASFNVVFDSKHCNELSEIWTFLKKINDNNTNKGLIEGFCPNCGNYIGDSNLTVCQSCKAFIKSGDYDWILIRMQASIDWQYSALPDIPKKPERFYYSDNTTYSEILELSKLKEKDPDYNILDSEDLFILLFWQIILFSIDKNGSSLGKLSREEVKNLIEKYKYVFSDFSNNLTIIINSVKIIGYVIDDLINQDLLIGEIQWSGEITSSSEESSFSNRTLLFLRRDDKATTNKNNYFSSLHCPICGMLVKNSDPVCCFCSNPVRDKGDWILTNIYNSDKPVSIEKIFSEIYSGEHDLSFNRIKLYGQDFNSYVDNVAALNRLKWEINLLNELYYKDKSNFNEYYLHKKMLKDMGIKTNQRNSLFSSSNHDYSLPELSEITNKDTEKDCDIKTKSIDNYEKELEIDWTALKRYSSTDLLRLAIAVMLSDGITDSKQLEIIRKICNACFFSEEELQKNIFEMQAKIDPIEFALSSTSIKEDENLMRVLLLLALSDEKIVDKETEVLQKIAKKMGFPEEKLMTIINKYR